MRRTDEERDLLAERDLREAQQSLLDAKADGREAGRIGVSVEMNPYLPFESEHQRWLEGWRETITQRRAA